VSNEHFEYRAGILAAANKLSPVRCWHSSQILAPLPGTILTPVPKQPGHTAADSAIGFLTCLLELSAGINEVLFLFQN
jgi:hypothetical protein